MTLIQETGDILDLRVWIRTTDHRFLRWVFCFIVGVVLPPMVVSGSQIVLAQAQTQPQSDHLKYDPPSQKWVSEPPPAP